MKLRRELTYGIALALSCTLGMQASAADASKGAQAVRMLRDAALVLMKEGNSRFAGDKATHPSADAERRETTATEGQTPLVTVLSCADSRVPVELIFDRGVGEIFTVRVAGNVADTDEIATVEYGVGHLGTPLLVVLGHSKCGAVTAVVKGAEVHGLLPQLLDNIQPAAERAKVEGGTEDEVVTRAIRENVFQSMADIIRRSSEVRTAVESGAVRMLGAVYDIHTGKVEWLGEHPEQKQILAAWSAGVGEHGTSTGSKKLALAVDLPDPADAPHAAVAPPQSAKPATIAPKGVTAAAVREEEEAPAPAPAARPPKPVYPGTKKAAAKEAPAAKPAKEDEHH